MAGSDETKLTHGVGSARRALQLLLSFTPDEPRFSPAELADRFEMPIGSIYRYTSLLRELGMIEDAPGGRLQLTPRILTAARAAMSVQSIVAVAEPLLRELAGQVKETVLLNQQTGDVVVCLLSVAAPYPMRVEHPLGHTMPLGSGATTKMILAEMNPTELAERLARIPDERRPGRDELDLAASRGWTQSAGELDEGVWACAAGLVLEGRPPMTVSVAGPEFRLDEVRRREIIDLAVATARTITESWLEGPSAAPLVPSVLR